MKIDIPKQQSKQIYNDVAKVTKLINTQAKAQLTCLCFYPKLSKESANKLVNSLSSEEMADFLDQFYDVEAFYTRIKEMEVLINETLTNDQKKLITVVRRKRSKEKDLSQPPF